MNSAVTTGLVLNINTPNYFQSFTHHTSVKRPLEENFATISKPTKKPKLIKSSGKAFRPSKKISKLKIGSSLKLANNVVIARKSGTASKPSEKLSTKELSIQNNEPNSNNREKTKVTFNSNVQVFPYQTHADGKSSQKLLRPDYIFKSNVVEKANVSKNKSPGKPIISSLFSKNPEIPELEKSDVKSSKQKLFSTRSFSELDISPKIISTVAKLGFTTMTLIQEQSIPVILEGSDCLIKSQTGSGKTLAYAVPLINKLMTREPKILRNDGLYCLVVVPTRELAVQTYQCLEKLCKACVWIVPGYLIGGEKKKAEKARIRKGINILVATPGRLIDHMNNTNSLDLNKVEYLVLDEADRMLDMGYEKNISSIMYALNEVKSSESRQTLLLSATLTSSVEKLACMSLRSPQIIDSTMEINTIGGQHQLTDDCLATPENLEHHYMMVPLKIRLVSLAAFIISKCKFSVKRKMLIFMTTQDMVDYHTSLFDFVLSRIGRSKKSSLEEKARMVLSEMRDAEIDEDEEIEDDREGDIHFMKLHGNMTQPERTAVFKHFHEASSGVLLCTDVASRGLDLPYVDWIIQYNPATNSADYVHRVGRTARASNAGSAVVFVSPAESTYISMLESHGIEFNQIRVEGILEVLSHHSLYDKNFERVPYNMEIAATRFQDKFENAVESDKDLYHLAVQGYVSFIRSYASIPKNVREYFCFKLLHLGHCAKSFALRDPPAVLGSKGSRGYQNSGKKMYKEKRNR